MRGVGEAAVGVGEGDLEAVELRGRRVQLLGAHQPLRPRET